MIGSRRAILGRRRWWQAPATTPDLGRRTMLFAAGNMALFAGLGLRLYDLQVLSGADQAALADGNRTRTLWRPAIRGRILDAKGLELAGTRETFDLVLYPRRGLDPDAVRQLVIEIRERAAAKLGRSLEPQGAHVNRIPAPDRTKSLTLASSLSFDDLAALDVDPLDGSLQFESRARRDYPALSPRAGEAMAHIVGHVGAVDRYAIDDEPQLRRPEARIGKAGVEAAMEIELRGVAGRTVHEIDARGAFVRVVDERVPRPGSDVRLTIDTALQEAVHARLQNACEAGAAVVLDIATGAILALASTPSFDPDSMRDPARGEARRKLAADARKPLVNRATAGRYPPGSTFKIVTALAALDSGKVTATERIECWGEATYAGHTFRCWNRKGHVASDLHKAIRESCDCYFYEAARRTGIDRIAAMARELGFGQTYEAGIPEGTGLIPTPDWKRQRSRTGWLLGETILAGIGQGYVLATPLQLAVMAARVASARKVKPTLVASAIDPPPAFEPLSVAQGHIDRVCKGLVAVVNEAGGTGHAADPDDGHTIVAGKTGTSQVSRASAERERELTRTERDHALFVAYFPAEAPRYAIATVLEHAGGGGAAAAPLARAIVEILLSHEASNGPAAALRKKNRSAGDSAG